MQNPFSRYIFETSYFPNARTRRTSLWQKFIDSFNVIHGDMSMYYEPTFGLFDIITLGILGALARFDAYIIKRFSNLNKEKTATNLISNWEKALYWSITIINLIFNIIPRLIISGLIAIVAFLPITLPVHLISSLVNSFSDSGMSTALKVKGKVPCSDGKTYDITLDEILNDEGPNPNSYHRFSRGDIEEISVTYSEKTKEARFRTPTPGLEFFYVKINESDDSKHYSHSIKSLFVNNIGNIANECPQIAKQIAKEESSASEENRLGI